MGCGASSSKNAVLPMDHSRAKDEVCNCQLYESRLKEKDTALREFEKDKEKLSEKVDDLNKLLAELEGEAMDRVDTIASLKNRLEMCMNDGAGDRYEETLKAKDQIIANLEKEIAKNETEHTKQRARWRRKLRHYGTQLAEEKHENAIRVMELRQDVTRLTEENEKLKKRKDRKDKADSEVESLAGSSPRNTDSHGLVLELSQQLLEQTNVVKKLEHSLRERERLLEELQGSQRAQRRAQRAGGAVKTSGRQWSGYSHDSGLDSDAAPDSAGVGGRPPHALSASAAANGPPSLSPLSERDSTAALPVPSPLSREGSAGLGDDELYRGITEDCNWDAASLGSSDTVGASPRLLALAARPTSARHDSASRPHFDRGRSIILDPDKEHTIDSVLQLTTGRS